MQLLSRLMRDETGATAVEYGLVAVLISVVTIGAITLAGTQLSTSFNRTAAQVGSANPH